MATIESILVLLVAVVLSGSAARLVPLPLPLLQIALGAALAWGAGIQVELDPDIFFLLFLPPLLFLDGWRIPKEGLFRDKGTILELALGLVIFTVIGGGLFIHWLIPAMPLPVAFALAAVLSPTDPIAVSAITARIQVPKRLMHILEGESLLNDASGLVCLRFAIAAAVTGVFAPGEAVVTFLWLALGGIAIGAGVTFAVTRVKNWITSHLGEEPGAQILISLLIPFGAYLLAEHLHCSGILAAVSAGIVMSYAELASPILAATRMRRTVVWDAVQFTANGIIFVLLGEQLPAILNGAMGTVTESGHGQAWWLAVYVFAIALALIAMRFVWVWTSLRFTLYRASRRGGLPDRKPGWRVVAAMSVAGVRGAITLAGVLTLPLTVGDGTPFPARDLAIFLAANVIIISLLLATVLLPRLLRDVVLPAEPSGRAREDHARIQGAQAAIQAIEQAQYTLAAEDSPDAALYADASARIMDFYRRRIEIHSTEDDGADLHRRVEDIEKALFTAALRAERDETLRLTRSRVLDEETGRRILREIDLLETRFAG
jgi:CPA1 family monovalent cation:H+ antiporter